MHGLHQSTWVGFAGNDIVKFKPNTTTLNFSKTFLFTPHGIYVKSSFQHIFIYHILKLNYSYTFSVYNKIGQHKVFDVFGN